MEDKQQRLFDQLDANLADSQKKWEAMSNTELVFASREIAAIRDAHYYLSDSHGFEPDEIDYLLLFKNPLSVVADKWLERTEDLSDFSFALDEVFDKRDALLNYELKEKPSVLDSLRTAINHVPKPRTESSTNREER